VLQALLVTFLWSTSWVLIKIGLRAHLPALTFAGLRYSLAFLCLAPFVLARPGHRATLRSLSRGLWAQLVLLGVVFYALTQGAQFLSLAYLPAATVNLLLSLTPVVVALVSALLAIEQPTGVQWGGLCLAAVGAGVFFLPMNFPAGQLFGLGVAVVGVLANAASAFMGRHVNHGSGLSPLIVTFVSMGVGAALLLITGVVAQGVGQLDMGQWAIVGWLAVVNTALAFTLWNHTLRTLNAIESSIIQNTMLLQISLLAWLVLAEPLSPKQIGGMVLVAFGSLIVQLRLSPGVLRGAAVRLVNFAPRR
jgi:drug/metabolite transporter (DMT)-like permease